MNTSVILSAAAIIIAFALLMLLSYKNWGITLVCILATALVALFSKGGFVNGMFTLFPTGISSFMTRMAVPVFMGMIFGTLIAASGASRSIGEKIVAWIGPERAPYAIWIVTVIFALAGLSNTVMIVAPLSYSVMKAAKLPNYIGLYSFYAACALFSFGLPGIPHNLNLLPTTFLGTTLYAGAVEGIIGVAVAAILSLVLTHLFIKKAKKRGEGFDQHGYAGMVQEETAGAPSFGIAILPLIIVIFGAFVAIKVLKLSSTEGMVYSQVLAVLVNIVTCRKYFKNQLKGVLESSKSALVRSAGFLVSCGCLTGFATVVADTAAYVKLTEAMLNWNVNPYIFALVGVAIICGITADAPSGIIMFCSTFAPRLAAIPGVSAGALHRICVMSASTLDSLPHCGAILLGLEMFGYDHKHGYKYIFYSTVIVTTVAAVVATVVAMIIN